MSTIFFRSVLRFSRLVFSLALVLFSVAVPIFAQQIHTSSPMRNLSDSFSESIGSSWGLSGKNWVLNVGGGRTGMPPQFGNFSESGLKTGFQFQRGGTSGYFNGWAHQNASRSNSTQIPSVTFMNGQGGYFQDVTDTPFVVSVIPVVGAFNTFPTPMPNDPTTTLSNSVLDQRIDSLNQQKAKPRVIREHPNAPALKQVEDAPRPKTRKTASSKPSAERTQAHVSRSQDSHTADSPALSVSEMKRRNRAKKKAEE